MFKLRKCTDSKVKIHSVLYILMFQLPVINATPQKKKLFIFFNLTRAGKYMNYYQSFEALRRNFFVSLQKNKKTKKKNKPRLPDPTSTLTLGKDNNLT